MTRDELFALAARRAPGPPTPEASARVQALIDASKPASLGEWPARALKTEHNALAIHATIALYCYGLRPDGTVLEMDLDTFAHRAEPVTDPLFRFAIVMQGALRHPELAELIPPPPPGTRPCTACDATGGAEGDCSPCRGFGWR